MKSLNEYKTAEKDDEESKDNSEYTQAQAKKLGRIQFLLVILLFAAVICATELVSMFIGKTAGTVAMAIIAAAIAIYLYKNEIKKWLKRR